MKYQLTQNATKTLTLLLTDVTIPSAKYLYKKYNEKNNFAYGVIECKDLELLPLINEILKYANDNVERPKGVAFTQKNVYSTTESKLFTPHLVDEERDGKMQISLSNFTKEENKEYLFEGIDENGVGINPIALNDSWKYVYAIELELSFSYDDDRMEGKVYSIFHRAVKIRNRNEKSFYGANNDAWKGFDFKEE